MIIGQFSRRLPLRWPFNKLPTALAEALGLRGAVYGYYEERFSDAKNIAHVKVSGPKKPETWREHIEWWISDRRPAQPPQPLNPTEGVLLRELSEAEWETLPPRAPEDPGELRRQIEAAWREVHEKAPKPDAR